MLKFWSWREHEKKRKILSLSRNQNPQFKVFKETFFLHNFSCFSCCTLYIFYAVFSFHIFFSAWFIPILLGSFDPIFKARSNCFIIYSGYRLMISQFFMLLWNKQKLCSYCINVYPYTWYGMPNLDMPGLLIELEINLRRPCRTFVITLCFILHQSYSNLVACCKNWVILDFKMALSFPLLSVTVVDF